MTLSEFFQNEKIEYFAVLPYERAIETKPHLAQKMPFVPKSIILYLLPYYVSECENISCYASSLDYHICIADINKRLENFLKSAYPCNSFQGYGDHSPIDERHAALISGLGIAGDNGLIINEKYGSYVFIADLISDVEPSLLGITPESEILRCEGCGACRRACPTGIIAKKGDFCLSAATQKRAPLTKEEAQLMRKFNTVWGCDLCQSSCPHNKNPKVTPIEFFHKDRITRLTRELTESMTDGEFSRRAFAWRGRDTVLRNLHLFEKTEG